MKIARNYTVGGVIPPTNPTDPTDPTEPLEPIDSNTIRVTVNFDSKTNPQSTFADMKYDKRTGVIYVKDDGAIDDFNQIFPILHGGLASDGNVYPGLRYTDGTGALVEWHPTFAINTANSRDQKDQYPGSTYWEQYNQMLPFGYSIANHSWKHGGIDKYESIKRAETDIFDKTGYRVRSFVVPTNDEGYAETASYLGYKIVGSQFGEPTADDNQTKGLVAPGKIDVKTIDSSKLNKFLFSRYYFGDMTESDIQSIKNAVDDSFNNSANGQKKYMAHMFTHGITRWRSNDEGGLSHFVGLVNYMHNHPNNNDNAWFPSMQEFAEYYETKMLVNKTQSVSGNTMTIDLDLTTIPGANLLRDMTLLISGGTINNIIVEGADKYTYNKATGLLNIFKKNKDVSNPYNDPKPPRFKSAKRSGNLVNIVYDKPVTQTEFSNTYGNAFEVSGNTITKVEGSGVNWTITCQNAVATGSKLNYRMHRGNAADLNGVRLCTYIDYLIL